MTAALKQGSSTYLPRRQSQDSHDGTLDKLKVSSLMRVLVSRETVVKHKHLASNKLIRVLLLLQN